MKNGVQFSVMGLIAIMIILFLMNFVTAVESAKSEGASKAYQCLESQIANKSNLGLPEIVFSILALGSKQGLVESLAAQQQTGESCWPRGGCKVKETAQVLLAYQRVGKQTEDIEKWLQSRRGIPSELQWYLEIDTVQHNASQCNIKYDGRAYTLKIRNDMTFDSGAGSCLTPSTSGYWLRVSNSCIGKSFEISCDQEFVSTLIYQKPVGETVYVSSATHSAPSLGTTNENVSTSCFKTGANCDYEGTLWAALALNKIGKDISAYTPYLIALSDDNQRYFPNAFLQILASSVEDYSQLIGLRKNNQYWEMPGTLYNRFYDTSLGMIALGSGSAGAEIDKTRNYLTSIQTREGCWNNNNVRDTAFILYSGWPTGAVSSESGTGKASVPACVEAKFSCERLSECIDAGGVKKEGFECPSSGNICCSVKVEKKSCIQEKGTICTINERCDGGNFEASDGACCLGSCVPEIAVNECEKIDGLCKSSCGANEEATSEQCSRAEICCISKQQSTKNTGWWTIILIILIILVVVAILMRDRLRMWWFHYRGRASSVQIQRPSMPPAGSSAGMQRMSRPQPFGLPSRSMQRQSQPSRPAARDNEMEDTLKKLRDMSET